MGLNVTGPRATGVEPSCVCVCEYMFVCACIHVCMYECVSGVCVCVCGSVTVRNNPFSRVNMYSWRKVNKVWK